MSNERIWGMMEFLRRQSRHYEVPFQTPTALVTINISAGEEENLNLSTIAASHV